METFQKYKYLIFVKFYKKDIDFFKKLIKC